MKLVAIIGSNNGNSITDIIVKKVCNKLKNTLDLEVKIFSLHNNKIEFCNGCRECFSTGDCQLDKRDDIGEILTEMRLADIMLLATPVYVKNVTGRMKMFLDRISRNCHLMSFAGILSFSLVTTFSNGYNEVSEYIESILSTLGTKSLHNFIYKECDYSLDEEKGIEIFSEDMAKCVIDKLHENYSYTSRKLETLFRLLRNMQEIVIISGEKEKYKNSYEYEYWKQKKIMKCSSFAEYAGILKAEMKVKNEH